MFNNYLFLQGERDYFIDFLKGVAIIFVIFTHNIVPLAQNMLLFCLWGAQAVPIFLLIQTYHGYNNIANKNLSLKEYFSKRNISKIYSRILQPFIYLLIIQIFILLLVDDLNIKQLIGSGGYGPGSYYVWIYLQFFILIPLVIPIFKKFRGICLLIVFIIISEIFELISFYLNIPEFIYRLLFFRYFILLYFGYMLSTQEFILNKKKIILSTISVLFIIAEVYLNIDFEPFFYNTGWKGFHWISYFYTTYLFMYVLKKIYQNISKIKLTKVIEEIGSYSYEIFLLQMLIFGFYPHSLTAMIISNKYIEFILFVILSSGLSILPVLVYKRNPLKLKYRI